MSTVWSEHMRDSVEGVSKTLKILLAFKMPHILAIPEIVSLCDTLIANTQKGGIMSKNLIELRQELEIINGKMDKISHRLFIMWSDSVLYDMSLGAEYDALDLQFEILDDECDSLMAYIADEEAANDEAVYWESVENQLRNEEVRVWTL